MDTNQKLCYDNRNPINPPLAGTAFHGQDAQYNGLAPAYKDNGDGTVTDLNTGLMWTQNDAGPMDWQHALSWAEHLDLAGHSDWRLQNAKELQSIVDYTRSPATSHSAAIDPIFHRTKIKDEEGDVDYAFYWTSTTHKSASTRVAGSEAVYVAFGEGLGYMRMGPPSGYGAMARPNRPLRPCRQERLLFAEN